MKRALFVGVNAYDDKTIRQLRYSIPDASVLADRFKGFGYSTRLLSDPTGAELKSAVMESVEGLGPGDVFLFFFAGHGFTAQDGAHLLFCRDDIQRLLCVNAAGIRVDAIEALTSGGGFHRAFLLDSCRTDCFAAMKCRGGGTTRDLDFVSVPKCTKESGSFYLLRSCDKFRPSLEFDAIGHGLFTQGLLDAMDTRDSRLAYCDTSFATAVGGKMEAIQRIYKVADFQRPSIGEVSGPSFSLWDSAYFESESSAGIPISSQALTHVECPICGRHNLITETFRCKVCGRDHACLSHFSRESNSCKDCAEIATAKRRSAVAEAARQAETERQAELARQREERSQAEAARQAERAGACQAEANRWSGGGVKAGDVQEMTLPGGAKMKFVWCPPGAFTMGSPAGMRSWFSVKGAEEGRRGNETQRRVALTKGFWLGQYEVTQAQWRAVMGDKPSCFKGDDDRPVERVSWKDCTNFIAKCNAAAKGVRFALPTEAQWEYACRAGTTGPYAGTGDLDEMGWYYGNSGGRTHPVGRKRPNAWNLYDMHGNVYEWCADWYGSYEGDCTDPTGPASGWSRVLRGGGWVSNARDCRSAYRNWFGPGYRGNFIGFRLLCSAGPHAE